MINRHEVVSDLTKDPTSEPSRAEFLSEPLTTCASPSRAYTSELIQFPNSPHHSSCRADMTRCVLRAQPFLRCKAFRRHHRR